MKISNSAAQFTTKNSFKPNFGDIYLHKSFLKYNHVDPKNHTDFFQSIKEIEQEYPEIDCYIGSVKDNNRNDNRAVFTEMVYVDKNQPFKYKKPLNNFYAWYNLRSFADKTIIHDFYDLNYAKRKPELLNEMFPKYIKEGFEVHKDRQEEAEKIKETHPNIDLEKLQHQLGEKAFEKAQDIVERMKKDINNIIVYGTTSPQRRLPSNTQE